MCYSTHRIVRSIPDVLFSEDTSNTGERRRGRASPPAFNDDLDDGGRIWHARTTPGRDTFRWEHQIGPFLLSYSQANFFLVSPGLPSKLRILPPKRKRTVTQIPEPRRNPSFLKGSWETVWGCDVDDIDFVEHPLERDVDSPSNNVADDQDGWFDHAVATPTNVAPWSTDGEVTPRFFSNFPSTPDSDVWREDHSNEESLRPSFSSPAELTPQSRQLQTLIDMDD